MMPRYLQDSISLDCGFFPSLATVRTTVATIKTPGRIVAKTKALAKTNATESKMAVEMEMSTAT
jgi:hypothetical protein